MILATPFVPGLTDYGQYADAIKRKGHCREHVHLVIARADDEEAAIDFDGEVSDLFLKTFCRTVTPETGGNVALANELFTEAVNFMRDYRPLAGEPANVPLLYSDPTWRPAAAGWLNTVQSDYFALGAPATMGRWQTVGEGDEQEQVLWGPVVISGAYARATALLAYLPASVHWRHYLRHEIGKVMAETTTFGTAKGAAIKPESKKAK